MSAPTVVGLDCGRIRTQRRTLVADAGTDVVELPVPAWLVRHPDGIVVFDVGLHRDLAVDSSSLGRLAALFEIDLTTDGTVGPRLESHDVDPGGALTVVLSHCHFDHVGGLVDVPNARVVVQRDEWHAARAGEGAYDAGLVDHGHEVVELDGPHDLFGDGSVTCVPTPGHTCGHQSLRVVTAGGPTILASDACYFAHTLDDGALPPFAHDHDRQRESLELLRRERAAGTTIVPGHDADVFAAWRG